MALLPLSFNNGYPHGCYFSNATNRTWIRLLNFLLTSALAFQALQHDGAFRADPYWNPINVYIFLILLLKFSPITPTKPSMRWSPIFPHFLNEFPPSQISQAKSQFCRISKIWYMPSQIVFLVVIKLTAVIQFLCLPKICWEWGLTILVKMWENRLFMEKIWLGGTLNSKWGKSVIILRCICSPSGHHDWCN